MPGKVIIQNILNLEQAMNNFPGITHFKISEFDSPDKPGSGKYMNQAFLLKLQSARLRARIPFKITSGYRTKARTKYLQKNGYEAVNGSAHEKGLAADIYVNSKSLNKILNALIQEGFTRVGISHNFIHVDIDHTKPNPAVWTYKTTPAGIRNIKDKIKAHIISIHSKKKALEILVTS